MARGYLYEISRSKGRLGSTNANSISIIQERMGIDCVSDDDNSNITRQMMLNHLSEKYGATIKEDIGIMVSKEFQINYFKEKYQKFMSLANEMTLEKFSTSSVYDLNNSIEDRYGDLVFNIDEDTWYTFDTFIRQAVCDMPYYIGNIMVIK